MGLYKRIEADLEAMGKMSAYRADANEPDPRYKSYGVRAAGKKAIISKFKKEIRSLPQEEQLALARRLIESEYGEQQSVGLFILEKFPDYFAPERFGELDSLVRCLRGWSKVDSFTGSLLRDVLFLHREPFLELVREWNHDADMWLRRTSVVLFTRKVAKSGEFLDEGLAMIANLIHAEEDLVQKGVGWALKDLMKADKPRVLEIVRAYKNTGVSGVIWRYAIRDLDKQERKDFTQN